MPYGKRTVDGEICVFRKNEDGELFGDSLGCHANDEKANAQIAALYANEPGVQKKDYEPHPLDSVKAERYGGVARVDLKASDFVFSDERAFPVMTAKDLRDAVSSWGRYKGKRSFEDFQRRLKALAKRKGLEAALPEKWKAESQKKDADNALCIKALGGNRIGGYAVLWGDENNKDLVGEWFTPQTEAYAEIYEALGKLPWLFHHGGDETVKTAVAGIVDILVADETGMWYEAQLRKANQYIEEIKRLIQGGKLWTSSGTLPAARKVAPTGEILRWPFTEISGTTVPAEWRMMERPIQEVKAAYKAIGLDFPDDGDADKGAEEARRLRIQTGLGRLKLLEMERQALNLTDSTE